VDSTAAHPIVDGTCQHESNHQRHDESTLRRARDSPKGRWQKVNRGKQQESFVRFAPLPVPKSEQRKHRKEQEVSYGDRQANQRVSHHSPGHVSAPRSRDGGHETKRHHRDCKQAACDAKPPVNIQTTLGRKNSLNDQQHIPTCEKQPVHDNEQRERRSAGKWAEIVRPRKASKYREQSSDSEPSVEPAASIGEPPRA
jgi:hypothetical protein